MKNEPKTSSIPYSHTSYHSSGAVNTDFVGKSGRVNVNNVTNHDGKGTTASFERADGTTITIKGKGDKK